MATSADHTFCPYKGLQPYTEADRKYFFGRTRDEGIIIANLYAASVTVFYGASGVGKSSVLLAGAVPRLKQEPRDAVVVVFNSWQGEDFLMALKHEVAKQAGVPTPIDTALPLDDFLAQTQRAVNLPLFLIFDQFEEYFLYHPPSPSADLFESAFARAVNRRGIQVNFFLSLREDGLSKLDRLRGRVPALLNNMLRLRHLDRASAREAITKPLDQYNSELGSGQLPMTIEGDLVEAVLNDLTTVRASSEQAGQGQVGEKSHSADIPIETPFLQVVLTRLWDEEVAQGSRLLRLQTFDALGRARNIARTHLDTIMDRLTEAERDDAANILRYLVTPSGTKIAQEAGALASWTELTEAQVQTILTRLSGPDMRILRTMQAPGELPRYEIFHDVLAQAILTWRARYVQEQNLRLEVDRARTEELEARKHARARSLLYLAVGLSLLLVFISYLAIIAWQAKDVANARALAAYSRSQLENDPELSLLLAIEAVKVHDTRQSRAALTDSMLAHHQVLVLRGHTEAVRDVVFSADGKYLVTASWDNTARVWEAATGKSVSVLREHTGAVNSASFSNKDGRYILTAGHDGKALVWEGWETGNPKVVRKLRDESYEIWTAAFSPNDDYILTGGGDGIVRVRAWKKSRANKEAELLIGSALKAAPSPSPSPTPPPGPEASPDASPSTSPSPIKSTVVLTYRAAFSPNGEHIIVASKASTVLIWEWSKDRSESNPFRLIGQGSAVYDAAFSYQGDYAVTARDDRKAAVFEWRKQEGRRKPLADLNLVTNSVRSVAFSPDGRFVATASDDGVARVWEWRVSQKPEDAAAFFGHKGIVFYVAYSRDGQFVATGGDDTTARIWRTAKLDKRALDALSVADLLKLAEQRVTRQLTPAEKAKYMDK